jgi:hypothetical protein
VRECGVYPDGVTWDYMCGEREGERERERTTLTPNHRQTHSTITVRQNHSTSTAHQSIDTTLWQARSYDRSFYPNLI